MSYNRTVVNPGLTCKVHRLREYILPLRLGPRIYLTEFSIGGTVRDGRRGHYHVHPALKDILEILGDETTDALGVQEVPLIIPVKITR